MNDFILGLGIIGVGIVLAVAFIVWGFWVFGPVWLFALFAIGFAVVACIEFQDEICEVGCNMRKRFGRKDA